MKIAFFSEMGNNQKYPRDFPNSRTEVAWCLALDAPMCALNVLPDEHFDLGMIYYLKNPSRIYGTLIENDDREIIIPGDENSLLIHQSNVNHQPVNPEPVVAKDYYRCVLVVDFVAPYKLEYYRSLNNG